MEKNVYFVTSDIHCNAIMLEKLLSKAREYCTAGFLIAGDLCPSSTEFLPLLSSTAFPLYICRGNCDSLWDYKDMNLSIPQEIVTLDTGTRTIALTHGHRISEPDELPIKLESGDIFITGHTHVPLLERLKSGVIHLNPGSPARPRSSYGATYAIIFQDRIEVRSIDDRVLLSLALKK